MNFNKNQNRREFLISTARNIVFGGLGFMGISLGYKTITSDPEDICEVNLPCRNCFKLGNCNEDKAVVLRKDLKENNPAVEIKTGNDNG